MEKIIQLGSVGRSKPYYNNCVAKRCCKLVFPLTASALMKNRASPIPWHHPQSKTELFPRSAVKLPGHHQPPAEVAERGDRSTSHASPSCCFHSDWKHQDFGKRSSLPFSFVRSPTLPPIRSHAVDLHKAAFISRHAWLHASLAAEGGQALYHLWWHGRRSGMLQTRFPGRHNPAPRPVNVLVINSG